MGAGTTGIMRAVCRVVLYCFSACPESLTCPPAYPYPNDEQELDRLDLQHHMFLLVNDHRLYFSPLRNPKRILDIGTGSGIWPIEMGMYAVSLRIKPSNFGMTD